MLSSYPVSSLQGCVELNDEFSVLSRFTLAVGQCSFPVLTAQDQQVRQRRTLQSSSMLSSISIHSSFSVGKITRLVLSPLTSLIPAIPGEIIVTPETDDAYLTQEPAIPIYAVGIIILVAGIIFFTIMYYKLKEFVAQNPIMGEIPQTEAQIVFMPQVTNAYVTIDGAEMVSSSSSGVSSNSNSRGSTHSNAAGDEEEAGIRSVALVDLPMASLSDLQAQAIEIQAVALPLGIVRRF